MLEVGLSAANLLPKGACKPHGLTVISGIIVTQYNRQERVL